jgi:hypothetical protein
VQRDGTVNDALDKLLRVNGRVLPDVGEQLFEVVS